MGLLGLVWACLKVWYVTGRECVFPEVNRNYNIGEKGANMNSQVFKQYFTQMSFNQELVRQLTKAANAECLLASHSHCLAGAWFPYRA